MRGTGNNTIIAMEAGLGANGVPSTVGANVFGSMHNVIWDIHFYNWESGFSTNVATILADQNSRISAMQTITFGDGIMPVICLEAGNSTNPPAVDPGGPQNIQASYTNPNCAGVAAWVWDSIYTGEAQIYDNLTTPGGASLNAYGLEVAGFIASGASTFPALSGPISGATASTYAPVAGDIGNTLTVSVTATNASGSSAPATSAATSAVTA
jgi:hypothetical protein